MAEYADLRIKKGMVLCLVRARDGARGIGLKTHLEKRPCCSASCSLHIVKPSGAIYSLQGFLIYNEFELTLIITDQN